MALNRKHAGVSGWTMIGVFSACVAVGPPKAAAEDAPANEFERLETHHIFGFTDGADIGQPGQKEIQFTTTVDHGHRRAADGDGFFRAIQQSVEFESAPTQSIEYSIAATGINHRIRGVEGLRDFTGTNFAGLSAELRYVLMKRGLDSPFGVTIQSHPSWGNVSEMDGRQVTDFAIPSKLVMDAELAPRRLYAALNLLYEPETWRTAAQSGWQKSATLGLTGGLVYRLTPQIALGGGLQYYRSHDLGFGFRHLNGQALFGGPTIYVELTKTLFISAAYSTQLRGHASGDNRAWDLTNFSRHMAWLLIDVEF